MASRRQRKGNRRSTRRQSGGVWPFTKKVDPLIALARAQAPAPPPKEASSWFSNPMARLRGSVPAAKSLISTNPLAGAAGVQLARAGAGTGAAAPGAVAGVGAAPGAVAGVGAAPAPPVSVAKKNSYLSYLTRQPAVDPALKTSTGLFKSVVEDVNWVRANSKNMIKGADPGKEKWAKDKEIGRASCRERV